MWALHTFERDEEKQDHCFPLSQFQLWVTVARVCPGSSGHSGDPPSLRLGQCRHAESPHVHVCGMWEEAGVPGGNPCRPWEDVPTPYRWWPWPGLDDFFSSGKLWRPRAAPGWRSLGCGPALFKVTSQCLNLHAIWLDGVVLKEINLKPPISSHNWLENVIVKQLGFLFVCFFTLKFSLKIN